MDFRNLSVPDVCGYKVKYYYSNKISEENPRNWTPHIHDTLEIYILVEGDVSFSVEAAHHKLLPGEVIITKPNELHNCVLNTRSVHRHLCFWFDTKASFIFDEFLRHDFGKGNHLCPDEEAKQRLAGIYDKLIKANEEGDTHAEFYLTLEILGILRKFISTDDVGGAQLPGVMQEILLDINRNLKGIKNLDYFTAKYFLSQSTLYRMFKLYLNTTPKLYIETKKLAYSRKLLKDGLSVADASLEAGFADVSNFIRLFKRRFGVTPREYKG
ncbi:MAG: AraC family transcriptional regulator [Clostridia bacterium]|nr:AraC family transcriptional regulator [Clostridia bacterium]